MLEQPADSSFITEKHKKILWRPAICLLIGIIAVGTRFLFHSQLDAIHPVLNLLLFGGGIVSAAFLLAWGAEALQVDLSSGLSTAILAFIAVLPEYSVDFYFAWSAVYKPDHAQYAAANMTGANRLLIGVGWSLVVLLSTFVWRKSKKLVEEKDQRIFGITLLPSQLVDVFVLALATMWSLLIPLTQKIAPWHGAGMLVIFFYYLWRIRGVAEHEPELAGVASILGKLPKTKRRFAVAGFLLFSGGILLCCSEPFAESLVSVGDYFHIPKFVFVQWLAPLASEAPELLVALIFSLRGHGQAGLAALLSSKVNQWTLLVGTLPFVYSVSSGEVKPLLLDKRQTGEFILTAAQSFLAIAMLAKGNILRWEAILLLVLFVIQLPFSGDAYLHIRHGIAIGYILLALCWLVSFRKLIFERLKDVVRSSSSERK